VREKRNTENGMWRGGKKPAKKTNIPKIVVQQNFDTLGARWSSEKEARANDFQGRGWGGGLKTIDLLEEKN